MSIIVCHLVQVFDAVMCAICLLMHADSSYLLIYPWM